VVSGPGSKGKGVDFDLEQCSPYMKAIAAVLCIGGVCWHIYVLLGYSERGVMGDAFTRTTAGVAPPSAPTPPSLALSLSNTRILGSSSSSSSRNSTRADYTRETVIEICSLWRWRCPWGMIP
jgi:hypothetical protein